MHHRLPRAPSSLCIPSLSNRRQSQRLQPSLPHMTNLLHQTTSPACLRVRIISSRTLLHRRLTTQAAIQTTTTACLSIRTRMQLAVTSVSISAILSPQACQGITTVPKYGVSTHATSSTRATTSIIKIASIWHSTEQVNSLASLLTWSRGSLGRSASTSDTPG